MKLNSAVIGLGFVGKAHVEALRRLGIPVRGALGSSGGDHGCGQCKALNLDHAYASLDELAADPATFTSSTSAPQTISTSIKPVVSFARVNTSSVKSH